MANGRGTKRRLHQKDPTCWYCGCMTWRDRNQPRSVRARLVGLDPGTRDFRRALLGRMATLEHLKRKADGGRTEPGNCVIACHDCNGSRGTRTPEEWREIKRRGASMTETTDTRGQPTTAELDARTLRLKSRVEELEAIARTQGDLIARLVGRLEAIEKSAVRYSGTHEDFKRMQEEAASRRPGPIIWPAEPHQDDGLVFDFSTGAVSGKPGVSFPLDLGTPKLTGELLLIEPDRPPPLRPATEDELRAAFAEIELDERQRELALRYEHGDPLVFRVDDEHGPMRYEEAKPPSDEDIDAITRRELDELMAEHGFRTVDTHVDAVRRAAERPRWTDGLSRRVRSMIRGRL